MATVNELKVQRKEISVKMKAVLAQADAEKRPLNAEERAEFDRMNTEVDAKGDEIDALEGDENRKAALIDLEAKMAARGGRRSSPDRAGSLDITGERIEDDGEDLISVADLDTHRIKGESNWNLMNRLMMASGGTYQECLASIAAQPGSKSRRSGLQRFLSADLGENYTRKEMAALQVDNDTIGGTLVVPEDFMARLIIFVNNMVFIRQVATVLPLTDADDIGVPSWETDPADADWTGEVAIGGEDSSAATGKRRLHPWPIGKLLKISKTLLRKSAIPAENLIRERLGYKFGVTEEKGFVTGSGANQPLGVFTSSTNGIGTGQDVACASTTAIAADDLFQTKFKLKAQYMASPNLRWMFNRTVIRDIRKLKDGEGRYLWEPGLTGKPDTLLDVPYMMSEYAPNTMTTGLYVGIIGDFTHYYIAESLKFELQRLNELYAGANQVGFIGRIEVDGMPVLQEAFARMKLA